MDIPVYILNLDRSKERYERISQSAEKVGLNYKRVSAIDGSKIDIFHTPEIDVKRFRRRHGKDILPGEAGCYLSHLRALSAVVNGDAPYAVIAEDDVGFNKNFMTVINELAQIEGWDIIKLANHRYRLFHRYMDVSDKVSIGRFLHGPSGSSAAYMVTKEGAKKLIAKLTPMSLPYDVALERGWNGFEILSTNRNIIEFLPTPDLTIAINRETYRNVRLSSWKRSGVLFFRASDYIRRIIYGLSRGHLQKKKSSKN